MKRWGLLVTAFYMIALVVLTMPVILVAWEGAGFHFGCYEYWEYWFGIGVLGIGQMLLLFVPVRIAERKLKSRRPLLVPVITAAFMTTVLLAAFVTFLTLTLKETKYKDIGLRFSNVIDTHITNGYSLVLFILAAWIIWSVVFYRYTKGLEPDRLMRRLVSWLLKGSILELLIAIPCHIFVRRRDDCCAPVATFWGIAAGIAIMLLSFGPGIFFLFVEKCKRSKLVRTSSDL